MLGTCIWPDFFVGGMLQLRVPQLADSYHRWKTRQQETFRCSRHDLYVAQVRNHPDATILLVHLGPIGFSRPNYKMHMLFRACRIQTKI